MRRLLASVIGLALVALGAVLPTAPAAADPVSSCSTSTGVLVVVDLRPFGGQISRGCDASPTNGFDALHEAGYKTQGTQHDGPAFVCRINGRPTAEQDPCVRTPPASAYWSYWHAGAGQKSWSYSNRGAMSAEPGDGSIDAWVFGGTDVGGTTGGPCFSPADARAGRAKSCAGQAQPAPQRTKPNAKATPTRQRKVSTGASIGVPSPAKTAAKSGSPSAPVTTTRTSTSASSSAARPSASTTSTPGAASAVPTIVDASQAAGDRKQSGGGSATPLILGLGLAVVLAAGAGVTMLRRRRAEADGS